VRRFLAEQLKPECLNLTLKHHLKIMVWGCMDASGVEHLHIVNGTFNASKYIQILKRRMLPSSPELFRDQFLFQDDSASYHLAKVVVNWMRQNNMKTLEWPA